MKSVDHPCVYRRGPAEWCLLLAWLVLWFGGLLAARAATLSSPDGEITATISLDVRGALVYSVQRAGTMVITPSRLGVTLNGADLGSGVKLGEPSFQAISESYPVLGGKSTASNRACTLTLPLTQQATGQVFWLEARAYDDGFAWRLIVPGAGRHRVTGEASAWTLPARSRVWFYERNSAWKLKTYAGESIATDVDQLSTVSPQGPVQCVPLVLELPNGRGYAAITEAALADYSGLRLRAIGGRVMQADFTEGENGFEVDGPITTPWRVTLVAATLDRLANSDLISALNPPPDPLLFADRCYIRPGRCVWRWWSKGTGAPDDERRMIDDAAELGFEYTLIDDGWKTWPEAWTHITELADYAGDRGVGVFLWKDSNEVADETDDYALLRTFLDAAHSAGVAGVKFDFFNGESKISIDLQRAALRFAAERRLMIVLHGVQKPTGEARTFPNEITREGIRGLELNKMAEGPVPPSHNAALPFTRYLVGHGDYTPLGYSRPGATTWAHQLATVVQCTSPLMVIAEHPDKLLRDPATRPALDVLKAIPAVWNETRVIAPSRIGVRALLARHTGHDWFLAILTGNSATKLDAVDLSFLGAGRFAATILSSPTPESFERRELSRVSADTPLSADLAAGDGMVVWFRWIESEPRASD